MAAITFRSAYGHEASLLGDVAIRSKGHWGYDDEFLDACRTELTFGTEDIVRRRIVVAESSEGIAGFYSIDGQPPNGELRNLWVIPERIGTGLGRGLWEHAVATASHAGYRSLRIEADPNAVGFYRAMGAEPVGEVPSESIPGRALPLLTFILP